MIKLQNINLSYHKPIFKNMNLEITTPGIYGIIGESGIGKSTILNILYGLELKYEGSYTFGETNVSNSTKIQEFYGSQIAFIHQDSKLISKLSAMENIKIACFEEVGNEEIYSLATKLNVTKETLNKQVKYLSGGEKQRVAILRGIINNPKVLLFDEPTSGLDKVNRQMFIDLIEPLKELGIIVIIVSHDYVLREYIDNIYEIYDQDIHLTKGENIYTKPHNIEAKKNSGLSMYIVKNLMASKVMVAMFMVVSIIMILVTLTLITPISDIIQEAQVYKAHTYSETDITVTPKNTVFSEEDIKTIENIEGVESVEPYGATLNSQQYNQTTQVSTNEIITEDNSNDFYYIENSGAYYYLFDVTDPVNVKITVNNASEYDDSIYYVEGEAPNNSEEIAISEVFANVLMAENNWDSVVGQTLPFNCSSITTGKTTSCEKEITGVVYTYQYQSGTPSLCYGSSQESICSIYVYEPANIENTEYTKLNVNLEEGANSYAVVSEISELGHYSINADDFTKNSSYAVVLKTTLKKVTIFYVLAAIFIFIVTLNYLMNKRREYAIYLTLGYSKIQIVKNSLSEIFILYTISYVTASVLYLVIGGDNTMNLLWLVSCYFIFMMFYILSIIYLILGMSKRSINKNLKS